MDCMTKEAQTKFFSSVKAISGHQLEILMDTDSIVIFDFGDRLRSEKLNVKRSSS